MNIMRALGFILEILKLVKDSDGDGRPDIFDDHPNDPERK